MPTTQGIQYFGDYLRVDVDARFRLPRAMQDCWTDESIEKQRQQALKN